MKTQCELSDSIATLKHAWWHMEDLMTTDPSKHLVIRISCLAIIGELMNYGQEYFTEDEIEFIESIATALTDGETINE